MSALTGSAPGGSAAAPRRERERDRDRPAMRARSRSRMWVRVLSFSALALYGVDRWARLMHPAPAWRLVGLAALAIALAAGIPPLRALVAGRAAGGARAARIVCGIVTFGLVLAAFPISGLRWHLVVHARIAVSARHLGDGLSALPNALVPYLGTSSHVRMAILLGAALLLLWAAAVIAFAPPAFGDGRRAAAALPLIALAVVPSTLVHPQLPTLQGLLLFALLALFMWGERIGRDAAAAALSVAAVAGVAGALIGPRIDQRHPWVDYRSWAGSVARGNIDSFNWNQSYGPLRWPQTGHEVLTVKARSGDYWKAEDLTDFDGTGWVIGTRQDAGGPVETSSLPAPDAWAQRRWSQKVTVTIQGMRTIDVIGGSGYSAVPTIHAPVRPGAEPGTWVADHALTPGTTYTVATYSPTPSARQLRHAGARYPWRELSNYLTLRLPTSAQPGEGAIGSFRFSGFHARGAPVRLAGMPSAGSVARLVRSSPYGGAYTLARQLAAGAATPYQFAADVKRHLAGYEYNQNPPPARYPLESFLFSHKVGYCQQFSGAMALLLRMGGVPARVAAGFTTGAYDRSSHAWDVSDSDAHSWVEAWFPRYGWVRFDPTPTSAPARGGTGAPPIVKRLPNAQASGTQAARRTRAAPVTATSAARGGDGSSQSPWPIIAAVVAALALAGAAWRAALARGRSGDPLGELERALRRTGRPLPDGVTLAGLEHRFRSSPDAAGYVHALRVQRYGGHGPAPSAAQRRALRYELRLGLGLAGRLRALWALPPRPGMPRIGRRPGP